MIFIFNNDLLLFICFRLKYVNNKYLIIAMDKLTKKFTKQFRKLEKEINNLQNIIDGIKNQEKKELVTNSDLKESWNNIANKYEVSKLIKSSNKRESLYKKRLKDFEKTKKDLINRPLKTTLENQISGKTKFTVYVLFNLLTLFFASLVSVKAFLFFGIYILSIILYSIKISKYPFVGNIFSVLLSVTPFFAIMLYYKNYSQEIISHSIFLFFVGAKVPFP